PGGARGTPTRTGVATGTGSRGASRGSTACSLRSSCAPASRRGRRRARSSPSRIITLSQPLATMRSGRPARSGCCSDRRDRARSTVTSRSAATTGASRGVAGGQPTLPGVAHGGRGYWPCRVRRAHRAPRRRAPRPSRRPGNVPRPGGVDPRPRQRGADDRRPVQQLRTEHDTPGQAAGTTRHETGHETQRTAEQRYVDALYARLDADSARVRAELREVLRGDPDDAFTRDVRAAMLQRRARTLDAADHHLCFGRIDHADGGSLHIGRTGLSDGDDQLLVDWRADAARPFYAATAAHPLGVRRRRHLGLDGRRVTRLSDELLDGSEPGPDDVVGDGPLLEAVGARRTGRMREVVATLQAEQDAIIRSPHRGVTVVEGGPGTGKTVVALHRAAYVLAGFEEAR